MSDASLDRVLSTVTNQIYADLKDQVTKVYFDELEKVRKKSGLNKLLDKIHAVENEIKKLEDLRSNLNSELTHKEGTSRKKLSDEVNKFAQSIGRYGAVSDSGYEAMMNAYKSTPAQNLIAYEKLRLNTVNMYNLAVSTKEKRNVILELQKRDWRSIGVDIPELPHFEAFQITDGKIKLPNLLSLPKGK